MTRVLSLVCLVLVAPIAAQTTKYRTSPAGYLTKLGGSYSFILGIRPDMRMQQGDGAVRGHPMRIVGLDYRLADIIYTEKSGSGRSWSKVTLHMAETDAVRFSGTFSRNVRTTPTLTFSGSVTWPTQSGRPKSLAWGRPASFPFTAPWVYTGKLDMLADWKFLGGVLENRRPWGLNNPTYYLEGAVLSGVSGARVDKVLGSNSCRTAFNRVLWNNFHRDYQTPSYANRTLVRSDSYGTTHGTAVFHAWGHELAKPQYIAALCNPLYIQPYIVFQGVSSKPTAPLFIGGHFRTPRFWFPTDPAFFGFQTGVQTGYLDSMGRISLGTATIVTLPGAPPPPVTKLASWSSWSGASTGLTSRTAEWLGLPRIAHR